MTKLLQTDPRGVLPRRIFMMPVMLVIAALNGCESPDERLARFAEESVRTQAEQNESMAGQGREIAQASRQLIEADAQARRELLAAQQQLQEQQAEIAGQRDSLETERRKIAAHRHRDPIVAGALASLGIILACLLPLILCWRVLRTLDPENTDEALGELLVMELAAERPFLLPSLPAAISPQRLTALNEDSDPPEEGETTHGPQEDPSHERPA